MNILNMHIFEFVIKEPKTPHIHAYDMVYVTVQFWRKKKHGIYHVLMSVIRMTNAWRLLKNSSSIYRFCMLGLVNGALHTHMRYTANAPHCRIDLSKELPHAHSARANTNTHTHTHHTQTRRRWSHSVCRKDGGDHSNGRRACIVNLAQLSSTKVTSISVICVYVICIEP